MNTKKAPLVSVIMPVHNGAEYLEQALLSVTNQTLKDIEIVVLDDGSTDGSLAIMQRLAAKDDRIVIYNREQKGLIATLNELVSLSKSEIIARMDADDICLPTRLEKQLDYLKENPDCDVLGTEIELINEKGMRICPIRSPLKHTEIEQKHLAGHTSISHPSTCFRKSKFLEAGGYSFDYPSAEDIDLWLRIGEIGKLANYDEILLLYRIHDKSISGSKSQEQLDSIRRAVESAWQRRGITGVFEAEGGWRAEDSIDSKFEYALQYGWMAWKSKHFATALHYFKKSLLYKFYSPKPWALLYATVFKRT